MGGIHRIGCEGMFKGNGERGKEGRGRRRAGGTE